MDIAGSRRRTDVAAELAITADHVNDQVETAVHASLDPVPADSAARRRGGSERYSGVVVLTDAQWSG
jgi:hypothetical protein